MNKSRESFVCYTSWGTILKGMPDNIRLRVYDAMFDYVSNGTEPKLEPTAMMAFMFIRDALDRDNAKWTEIKQKRSEAGKRGCARRWGGKSQNIANIANATDAISESQTSQKVASVAVNVNDNVNANGNVDVNVNGNVNMDKEDIVVAKAPTMSEAKASDSDVKAQAQARGKSESEYCERIRGIYNEAITQMGSQMPRCTTKLTGHRKAYLLARTKDYGEDKVIEAIGKACGSSFLGGDNARGFRANFEWIMRPNNFPKILDGNYDNRTNNGMAGNSDAARQQRLAGYAEVAAMHAAMPDTHSEQDLRKLDGFC